MIKVTENQNRYLLLLEKEPRTTNDLMRELMVTMETASRMMRRLKKRGLVKSEKTQGCRGNQKEHSLAMPYEEIVKKGLIIRAKVTGPPITEAETLYAAILRNGMMTGQELTAQHIKVFPDRAKNGVSNVVDKARKAGLCR